MIHGLVGRKKGMTQIFSEDGKVIPVTVIEAGPCQIVQVKTTETDGYEAVQVGFGEIREKRLGKPRTGHFRKHGPGLFRWLSEFRMNSVGDLESGQQIVVGDVLAEGDRIDVRGTSKGRGFAGTIKRHNFAQGDMTHGGMCKRRPGAIGMCATPARVLKGHKMAGRMGGKTVTIRNLEVVGVDVENNMLLVKGAVPGALNGRVEIRKTKKGVRGAGRANG
ncbi:MAG: 50S ribosomal protein L3 [Gemmatimonadota bacterium]|jgi:large subunit ribosomal protein L3|nr:50S ribosomal protein L3 [Gemmatimonadota bacterium]MDP6530034.1 50S ribosomal protein L3 [Gemmatimonadota bacterium]MDP6803419.1 50S ribosomal protein L3 [Gemmatimonadota bacterium]MDP7032372.1 50S ribosomal protein L3 [Gemmatimonadota bacterium]